MSLAAQTFLVVSDDRLSESAIRAALPTSASIRFVPINLLATFDSRRLSVLAIMY